MHKILIKMFHDYIRDNNPELLMQLENEDGVENYLSGKVNSAIALMNHLENEPDYIIEEACMEVLTQELRPSKFKYIVDILEEEFPDKYKQLLKTGTLKFEVINMMSQCKAVFEELHFSEENEDNSFVRFAIIGEVGNYIDSNK